MRQSILIQPWALARGLRAAIALLIIILVLLLIVIRQSSDVREPDVSDRDALIFG
ncbi:MAG TPA: hypothetical protein VFH89_04830 [Sphingomicrobium sp.]|nr:hypothetical protein [Sphingomicrobium sp.]